jgi:hypothetical protein
MACYKARGFLQKAESLGLTAFGLGQTIFGFGDVPTFKAHRSWVGLSLHPSTNANVMLRQSIAARAEAQRGG